MEKIVFTLYLVVLIFGMQCLYSQVVATVCIENKHTERVPSDITLYIENKLMDRFFNEGFIITNLPYMKEEIAFYNSYKREQYVFDGEPDYIIILYFSYEGRKKYDEARRKDILPCKTIYCKVIKRKSSQVLYEKVFELQELEILGLYRKLDYCLSVFGVETIDAIRRSK